jgi:hypothetical protein
MCRISKKLKCKNDYIIAVYQRRCGFTFFNRCWSWSVSLARNKPWIFIYSSIQYFSHLVFFFYVIRNVNFIYRDCSWTKNTICWRKNLKLILQLWEIYLDECS